jgi:hypothetical protein
MRGRTLLATFTLLGLCAGVLAMYAAWQHNSQGEIHDETGVYWGYWLGIGFSWFVLIAGIPWLVAAVITITSRLRRS